MYIASLPFRASVHPCIDPIDTIAMTDISLREQALHKFTNKTKPPFSLGQLETVAIDMAAI